MSVDVHDDEQAVDVCLIVEGCYPYVAGGVSSWLDWLIKQQPERRFGVVAIVANDNPPAPVYTLPPAVVLFRNLVLSPSLRRPRRLLEPDLSSSEVSDLICRILTEGDPQALGALGVLLHGDPGASATAFSEPDRTAAAPVSLDQLLSSRFAWNVMVACYHRLTPQASFPDFFWAWRTLVGGLFSILTAPLPVAGAYHTISTGYAGLLAARASIETGRPAAVTEHGIYTNERRIDLLMAEWITDTIGASLSRRDERLDIRDFWITAFESYAKVCYRSCSRITTLYGRNQAFQTALGAPRERLEVIPNGIHFDRYAAIEPDPDHPPTVALIGRIVPIKDIKTFIAAAGHLRRSIPDLRALLLGPTDEDPGYYAECVQLVDQLGLGGTVEFAGKVNVIEYLPRVDVMLLTSISEAQPLVLLEAGAAGIPCVATDVGSCREIIEGLPDESPTLGPGGRIVPLMAPEATAEAVAALLTDEVLRRSCGETLRRRVQVYFTSEASAARYSALYDMLTAA
ncbi:MAG: GT4 family glycosyltransferase PelF [Thiohalocapsa sp.]|jgi:glycosyltransferase involved in cell wall biosynthesis|nr:GT4 family glycosyltransferase PelF [Thiohalocapsa sp.]